MSDDRIGDIVHVRHGGRCYAGVVIEVGDDGTLIQTFRPPNAPELPLAGHAYVSLKSARPTSGWHWPREH